MKEGDPGLAHVMRLLEADRPNLYENVCRRIWTDLDSYSSIGREALEASIERNLQMALQALRLGRPPAAESLIEAVQTASERFDAGVPVEEIIRAFRICIAGIHERFVDLCIADGIESSVTIAGSRILWGVGDAFMTRVVTTYHFLDLNAALRDAQHRVSVARVFLAGMATSADTARYAIDSGRPYGALRAQATSEGGDAERIRRKLETLGSAGPAHAFIAVDEGEYLGVVAQRPTAVPGLTVGIGPFVAIGDLADSDQMAHASLRAARQLGAEGIFGVEELGWRLAASEHPEVSRLYAERYLAPLKTNGVFGAEIVAALRAYLKHDHNMTRTAEELHVHENTVRYRLRRFEELTGARLTSTECMTEVLWALDFGGTER